MTATAMIHRTLTATLLALCLTALVCGCAGHYYRTHTDGGEVSATFYLRRPQAKAVIFFASTDGYRPQAATLRKGRWVSTQPAATSFTYFYTVDGEVFTPECRYTEQDDYGQKNCIFLPAR